MDYTNIAKLADEKVKCVKLDENLKKQKAEHFTLGYEAGVEDVLRIIRSEQRRNVSSVKCKRCMQNINDCTCLNKGEVYTSNVD